MTKVVRACTLNDGAWVDLCDRALNSKIDCKAGFAGRHTYSIQGIPFRVFHHYYFHYFHYYSDYSWISEQVSARTSTSYRLQPTEQRFQEQCRAKWWAGEGLSHREGHHLCWSDTIISIIRLLYASFSRLYALFQDMKLQFGSVFIAETFPLGGRESCTSAVIVLHNQSALIFAGCSGGSHFTLSFLDVSQLTGSHGWTKLIFQIINSLCDCSAPFVIRKTKIETNLKRSNQGIYCYN